MRPRDEIIAWRAQAAWPTFSQVEQDLLLTRAMIAIFRDPFLSGQVAMRGGTILHKVHLAPAARYSEDIDLVLVGGRPIAHIRRGLERVLAPLLGRPVESILTTMRLAVRNALRPSNIIRLVYEYEPTVRPPPRMKVKIEVNYSETKPCYAIVGLDYKPPIEDLTEPVTLRSYDLNELLGTKMRALLQRSQGRDLFDLDRACRARDARAPAAAPLFEPDRVVHAFLTYMEKEGTRIKRGQYEADLRSKCAERSFRLDMAKVLPDGIPYDLDEAEWRVCDVLIARLPR